MTPGEFLDDTINGRNSPELQAYWAECVVRAMMTGLPLDRVFGITGNARKTWFIHCRDRDIREGARLCGSAAGFRTMYAAWCEDQSLFDDDPEMATLCADLAAIEAEGVPVPGHRRCQVITSEVIDPEKVANVVPMRRRTASISKESKESQCQSQPLKSRP